MFNIWSVNYTSIYENSELNTSEIINFFGEISNNWQSNLFGIIVYKTLEPCWKLSTRSKSFVYSFSKQIIIIITANSSAIG